MTDQTSGGPDSNAIHPSGLSDQKCTGPEILERCAGSKSCKSCHSEHYLLWEDGGHHRVDCETCHGPAEDHICIGVEDRKIMKLPGEAGDCLVCHGIDGTSPVKETPWVESLEKHVRFVGEKHSVKTDIDKMGGRCIFCHDPHSLE